MRAAARGDHDVVGLERRRPAAARPTASSTGRPGSAPGPPVRRRGPAPPRTRRPRPGAGAVRPRRPVRPSSISASDRQPVRPPVSADLDAHVQRTSAARQRSVRRSSIAHRAPSPTQHSMSKSGSAFNSDASQRNPAGSTSSLARIRALAAERAVRPRLADGGHRDGAGAGGELPGGQLWRHVRLAVRGQLHAVLRHTTAPSWPGCAPGRRRRSTHTGPSGPASNSSGRFGADLLRSAVPSTPAAGP